MKAMNKCGLCQQLDSNLKRVYNNRVKYLADIILKLKGFKNILDFNNTLLICKSCNQSIENFAAFWGNVPEAESETPISSTVLEEFNEQNQEVLCKTKLDIVPIQKLTNQEQCGTRCAGDGPKCERIKLRIKLPPKRKKADKCISTTIVPNDYPKKRNRQLPKSYEDFIMTSTTETKKPDDNSKAEPDTHSEVTLDNLPQIASLRLANGQNIGKLVEVDKKEDSIRMRIICINCCKAFRFEKPFQNHIKTYNTDQQGKEEDMNDYLYYCKICDKPFPTHSAVRKHFKSVHSDERPLKCDYCEASFKYQFNLHYHMSKHLPKKRFECVFCKKMFLMRYELEIHLRTHTKEKPYKCDNCSCAFAHRSNLKAHQRLKHSKDSANLLTKEGKNISNGKFKPPQILLEDEKDTMLPLNDLTDLNFSPDIENFTSNLNNESLNLSRIESSHESTVEFNTKLITTNDSKIFRQIENKERFNENFMAQNNFATFKIESSIMKVLPSVTLLDLKKWPKSFQSNQHLSDVKDMQIIDNKYNTTKNYAQSWEVVKCSAIPEKFENNLNSEMYVHSAITNNTGYETAVGNEISNEAITDKPSMLLETTDCLTSTQTTALNVSPNSNNVSKQQSLLKPLKTQQITKLSLKNSVESTNMLSTKPLITKLEILPPLNIQSILQKPILTKASTSLIKPLTGYKYQCHYCYKYFKQKSPLTKHLRTHTGEKPYKCNLCPKSYADASNYKKHKILHKNSAEALNISKTSYAVQNSPAYSTVSDPDPDGIEVMQTLKKFEFSSIEDDDDPDDASTSTMESDMWQDALEQALNNHDIRDNIKRNLAILNNAILPKITQ